MARAKQNKTKQNKTKQLLATVLWGTLCAVRQTGKNNCTTQTTGLLRLGVPHQLNSTCTLPHLHQWQYVSRSEVGATEIAS
jgi:hypothetical protein